jgi:hypothetical protein
MLKPEKKLSEYLIERLPHIKLEDAKNAIIVYRDYMHFMRGKYCDVCHKPITAEEASKTTLYDFNYCCNKHAEYRNVFQLDIIRKQLGIEVKHNEMFDIYDK